MWRKKKRKRITVKRWNLYEMREWNGERRGRE